MLRTGQSPAPPRGGLPPLRPRALTRRRECCYRGPWRLPGPDSHRLAAVSLRSATPSTSLLSRRPSYWTHIPPRITAHTLGGKRVLLHSRERQPAPETPGSRWTAGPFDLVDGQVLATRRNRIVSRSTTRCFSSEVRWDAGKLFRIASRPPRCRLGGVDPGPAGGWGGQPPRRWRSRVNTGCGRLRSSASICRCGLRVGGGDARGAEQMSHAHDGRRTLRHRW